MRTFTFTIADDNQFTDSAELPSEDAAWREALRLVRDIELSLKLDSSWVVTVSENGEPLFRITVTAEDLRLKRTSS